MNEVKQFVAKFEDTLKSLKKIMSDRLLSLFQIWSLLRQYMPESLGYEIDLFSQGLFMLFITDQFWKKPQGPVFFYTGNEGAITAFWNASGFVHQLAEAHKALIIFAEHVSTLKNIFN